MVRYFILSGNDLSLNAEIKRDLHPLQQLLLTEILLRTRNNFNIFSFILKASAGLLNAMMRQLDTILILVTIKASLRGGAPQEEANCLFCDSLAGGEKKSLKLAGYFFFTLFDRSAYTSLG